jgi:hypothetical protein
MLPRRIRVSLILQQREGADEFGSRLRGLDHFVDEAAFGVDRGSSPTVREGVSTSYHLLNNSSRCLGGA